MIIHAHRLHLRLAALVGDEQALELLESPNSHLGGRTPLELIDKDDFAPVEAMIREMEANAGVSKQKTSNPFPHHSPAQ